MFEKLLRLYQHGCTNPREPRSLVAETELFNETWLLRGVLATWRSWRGPTQFPFLPFPDDCIIRSPAQIYTPFKKRKRSGDSSAETNTRADGLAGHFMPNASKSGMDFARDGGFFGALEGKMYSGFSRIKNFTYSQLSRTVSCMGYGAAKAQVAESARIVVVVLLPVDNRKIDPNVYTDDFLMAEIEDRIAHYRLNGTIDPCFESSWKSYCSRVKVEWVRWESVVAEINNVHLTEFYRLCKLFGKSARPNTIAPLPGVSA